MVQRRDYALLGRCSRRLRYRVAEIDRVVDNGSARSSSGLAMPKNTPRPRPSTRRFRKSTITIECVTVDVRRQPVPLTDVLSFQSRLLLALQIESKLLGIVGDCEINCKSCYRQPFRAALAAYHRSLSVTVRTNVQRCPMSGQIPRLDVQRDKPFRASFASQ